MHHHRLAGQPDCGQSRPVVHPTRHIAPIGHPTCSLHVKNHTVELPRPRHAGSSLRLMALCKIGGHGLHGNYVHTAKAPNRRTLNGIGVPAEPCRTNAVGYMPMRYNRKAKAAQLSAFFAFFFSIIQSCKILLPNATALGQEALSLVILRILRPI